MTTLQIVLAIVGVSLIAIIVLYNILQERKFRREADRMFAQKRDDIILGESVLEEVQAGTDSRVLLSDDAETAPEARQAVAQAEAPLPDLARDPARLGSPPAEAQTAPAASARSPAAAPAGEQPRQTPGSKPSAEPAGPAPATLTATPRPERSPAEAPAPAAEAAQRKPSPVDGVTEYAARIKFATAQAANFSALLATLRRVGKPVRAFGEKPDGVWEVLSGQPRSVYGVVEFGLQLADRGGAVSRDQLDAFCRALYEFAAEEGGAVSCGDKEEALRLARELDLFCMDVDVLIGLNVISADSRPFTSEAIHTLAQEARLSLEADGTYHAKDEFGHTLFTLANQEEEPFPRDGRGLTTHGITLLFDVPRVADGLAVFDRMTRLGFDLAWRLEGRLVADNSRPVSEDSLSRDRTRLAQFYARMEGRGIPAGGERARRLFV